MIRPVFTELALFLTPFILYAVFLWVTRPQVLDKAHWPLGRILWLVIVALVLVTGSFVWFAHFGTPPGTGYVPARVDESGELVPGRSQ